MQKFTKEQIAFFVELPDGRVKLTGWSAGRRKWCSCVVSREIAEKEVAEARERWNEDTQQMDQYRV